ncbi:MAG: hypothetical protein HY340_03925 [Candidatus Kerfeldbacteria bacterium]|nr:hypothetical protein [Candidatus Kerfeldbacteria bacterium]
MIVLLWVILGATIIALLFALNSLVIFWRTRVPYVPSSRWAVDWVSDNLNLPPGSVVIDLGCGDGRVLCAIVRAHPNIRGVGYERNWFAYLRARWATRRLPVDIRFADFYQADFSEATALFCFLIQSVMPRVERLLAERLRRETAVLSYGFRFPTWLPAQVIANPARPHGSKLFLYQTTTKKTA